MVHYCYIIYSEKLRRYYVGESPDVSKRLVYHNSVELNTNSTKAGIPWELKLIIACVDRSHALRVERHIKRMKSKVFIEHLIVYPELVQKVVVSNL